jgi:hypothetical protein
MFGERYFATRERLAALLRGITELAVETGADVSAQLPLAELKTGLGHPFLLVVCGEVNAGKSTLLNSLFGHALCRVSILPETDRVRCYRHGDPAHDLAHAPLLVDCYRPLEFLKDFNLVDTPGTNSLIQGHQQITESLLPKADLILCVFPISNPWGAATWDAISRMPAAVLDRVVFIVQQADQRDPKDITVIRGHLADLSQKRIGQAPPVFAVSAKLACEAKHALPVAQDRLMASGLPALEDFISQHICLSPTRLALLETWRGQAAAALRCVEDRIEDQSREINSQGRFIEQVEREIDEIREHFVTRLPRHLAGVAEVFESEAVWVTKRLRRRLMALPSMIRLFTGDRTGPAMESVFIERLQAAVEDVAHHDAVAVAEACRAHWAQLGARVQAAMGVDLHTTDPIDATLAEAKTRFVQRLGRAARQGVGNLKVRNQLDKELRRRNLALKSSVFMTLVLTIAGATCGTLKVAWAPAILCGLATLFLAFGVLAAWATRKPITRDFQRRLLDACGAFASTLHSDYEEALRSVFQDYALSLGKVRTHLAREKLAIEPRLRRWQELFLTLKAIEQEL